MNARTLRRLESLEQKAGGSIGKVHLVFGSNPEELEQEERKLMASPEWAEGDHLISVRWMTPGEAVARGVQQ